MNSLIDAIPIIKAATQDLRKCNRWYRARDEYIDLSMRGDDDWTRFDDAATTDALRRIQLAMTLPADELKQVVVSTITGLITHCAVGHSNQCERNGTL